MYMHIFIVFDVIESDAERAKVGLDITVAFPQATPASKFPPCGKNKSYFLV